VHLQAIQEGYSALYIKNTKGDENSPECSGLTQQCWDDFLKAEKKKSGGCLLA
jgi:hypothetical protein